MPSDSSPTFHERETAPPSSENQLHKLIEVISRSQQGFRELIDHLDQAVFTLTLDGEIRVANVRFSEILAMPFADLIGHNLSEFIVEPSPVDVARVLPAFLRKGSWAGRAPVRFKKSGEVHFFDVCFQAVVEAGRTTAVSGWARDVTAQHDRELRSVELFESLHEGILFSTPNGRILDANPALVRMLGYSSKEELQGRNLSELYADPTHRSALIAEIDQNGFVHDVEIMFVQKDGTQIRCVGSALAIRDAAGALVRIQATIRDVTEQRLMEHELHKEREFGRRLIACFPDVIALLDTEARFTYVSDSVRSVLGNAPSFFIGEKLGSHSDPEDRARLDEMMHSLVSGRAVRGQVEVRARHADGSLRSFRISAAPLLDETGKITGIVTSGRDVTESNIADRQVAEREKFTAMGQMLAGAAHELNNPLTAILGVSDLLSEHAHDDLTKRQAGLILKQARRAADIVQNLLAFSRPRASGLVPLRIEDILQTILLSQRVAFEQKGITMKCNAAPGLPPVDGDRKLLTQVFSNIIVNAEQAISSAKAAGTVTVNATTAPQNRVCLTFENDGPAITEENMGKLFDPFFTTKRPGGGSGLGLTICLAIVKDHGGTIEVESPAQGGAVFRIFLPAAASAAPAGEPATSPASEPAKPAESAAPALRSARRPKALEGRSVLVVDDEESILEIVQEGLSARGARTTGVSSGAAALAFLEKNACEAVVCDFNMPGMKGGELFERVRRSLGDAAPRFIFMTGELVESSSLATLREQGAFTLQKPFHLPTLAELLQGIFQPRA
ncbi:MAG TPA: PAS domain S-box protein [Candidatus Acidoferrum sp.]|jgi:PAS domain S-box-containing protein|nr:PAS domain S-box protein [Candidatus Acidoferrum sp.]